MDDLAIARALHVLAVVHWIGGVSMVTLVLLPAVARLATPERRIELFGEGFRNQDCLRLLSPIPGKSNIGAIAAGSTAYIWPIPSGERAANALCEPNP